MALTEELEFSNKKLKRKLESFSKLLDEIDALEDKKKALWKEIYENALMDRENACIMFMKLYEITANDSSAHAIHGPNISKYLERMNKANDQLIKLAELIQNAEKKSQNIDTEDIFRQIQAGR